jgi:aldehyde:ferredoxin oxidoreductase
VLGTDWTMDDVTRIGKEILELERGFNARAGFTNVHDRLPEFMRLEPLSPHDAVWDITDAEIDKVFT